MTFLDPTVRALPDVYRDAKTNARALAASFQWQSLSSLLKEYQPKGLGLVVPFSWQMHWYAYQAARAQGIVTAVAMPTNPSALSGLMRSVDIDAVLTSEVGAIALHQDLIAEDMIDRVRLWIVATPQGTAEAFAPQYGKVVYIDLP